jgi:uncharacterized membrane protein required for colicin V production
MIDLSALLWVLCAIFAVQGYSRGWKREMIGMAGIILGLFALYQFDSFLRGTLLSSVNADQVFLIQLILFFTIVFFAFQTRTLFGSDLSKGATKDGRGLTQNSILGSILGFINGYLIWGSVWYFIDINEYPLTPYIVAPAPGSASDQIRNILPLVILGGGPNGNGDLLAVAVIALFVIVLILI